MRGGGNEYAPVFRTQGQVYVDAPAMERLRRVLEGGPARARRG